jgi:hypothetical protein
MMHVTGEDHGAAGPTKSPDETREVRQYRQSAAGKGGGLVIEEKSLHVDYHERRTVPPQLHPVLVEWSNVF